MSLTIEKNRIAAEIDGYLKGKHDPDKVKLASVCRMTVGLAISYRELLNALRVFRNELTALVGRKNAKRWFSHSAGQLDKVLGKAIERCTVPAENEQGMSRGMLKKPQTTIKDWNRNSGNTEFNVNGRAFRMHDISIEDVRGFLREAGIANEHIRDFVCDYFNQDGLLAMGHAFGMAVGKEANVLPNFSGAYHSIKTKGTRSVACLDRSDFSSLIPMTGSGIVNLKSPLQFITTFDLVDDGRDVQMSDVEYALANLDAVPKEMQPKIRTAITKLNAIT